MIKKFKFDYDYENDNLFIYDSKSKSKASIELDNIIIDYNTKKEISAIELINATNFFKEITKFELTKDKIKEITLCKIETITKNNFYIINLELTFKNKEQIATPIIIPTVNEPSPAIIAQ